MSKSILVPLQYDGTMHSALLKPCFAVNLLPSLPANSIVVMDNASFHVKENFFPSAEQSGARLVFLPPYSPELNPVERL